MSDEKFMREALKEAQKAFKKKEVPVGAVAVLDGKIVARAHNEREDLADPTAHAEILCIKLASKKLGRWRLNGLTLYSTLEPCSMCAGAIVLARIKRVVYGAQDLKTGAHSSLFNLLNEPRLNHKVEVLPGVLTAECERQMSLFFETLRKRN